MTDTELKALGVVRNADLKPLTTFAVPAKAKFYVEVESHPARKAFQNAMEELHFFSENVHILGTYAKVG